VLFRDLINCFFAPFLPRNYINPLPHCARRKGVAEAITLDLPSRGRDIYVFHSGWLLEPIASGRLTLSTPLRLEGCPLGWEWFSILFGLGAGRRRGIEYFLRLNLRQWYIDESSWGRVVDRPKWKPDPDAGSERKPVEWRRFQCLWPFVG
jgi:hypothetical protein